MELFLGGSGGSGLSRKMHVEVPGVDVSQDSVLRCEHGGRFSESCEL